MLPADARATVERWLFESEIAQLFFSLDRNRCGLFLLDVGISSSFHIAKFFGLTAAGVRSASPKRKHAATPHVRLPVKIPAESPQPEILYGEVLDKDVPEHPMHRPASPRVDIGAVITKALTAAGLMRGK